jgi:hypothetical protein
VQVRLKAEVRMQKEQRAFQSFTSDF